ncbi:MAG: glycosyl hydrolase 115 family protein [Bacteroidales bacterium]|nr:glycosyl hydrolase 115 family protein [Bacteroidales bacterium]
MKYKLILTVALIVSATCAYAQNNVFCIAKDGIAATIIVDSNDQLGVERAARDLGDDVRKVTGTAAVVVSQTDAKTGNIIVGTIGSSKYIDKLVKQKRLDVKAVRGQWESYVIEVIDGNLIIAGSDRRGTIYGIYDISERIGVSPWYWWADVPVKHQDELYYDGGRFVQPSPKVKYRGIFINDESPSFSDWSNEHFGGQNAKMYTHMFELILRLKGNYLWPAMWGKCFNEDDPDNPRLANEYGIVMGTSHHEPMMRSQTEYTKRRETVGPWDYSVNKEGLDAFFLEGMQRNKDYDNLVTIGMRGDGDVAMGKGDDEDNMKTLAEVIKGQRAIFKKLYGREDAVPQMWPIFTEVQRYYDAGFRVPDDVTIMVCDNNWGYIRRIGRDFERARKGGLGLYYHIDMNGGPWNDRWVNTTTIPKLREQLNLAYKTGIDRIWLINVGDLKPKEVPIDFILRYAWDPDAIQPGDEKAWLEGFTASAFGAEYAEEAADLIAKYSKYNLWRKAEAQVPGIFNKEEMAYTDSLWLSLAARAEVLRTKIPAEAQDAFYQLVYYPVVASVGVAVIYNAATQGNSQLVEQLMSRDRELSDYYHKMADGKWSGMMQDKHIGYTQWSMPNDNVNPLKLSREIVEAEFEARMAAMNAAGAANSANPAAPARRFMFRPASLDFNVPYALQAQPETDEYSIPAYKYNRKVDGKEASWIFLPDLGRGEGCMGSSNVMAQESEAVLEYSVIISDKESAATVAVGILPTQDIMPERGLRIGIQLDDMPMQTIDARRGLVDTFTEYTADNLARSNVLKPLPERSRLALSGFWNGRQLPRRDEVFDNLRWLDATFPEAKPGRHTLKIIMIDPEIVVEQIVVNPDNNHYSYFGKR